jgi:dienelactone hydrolase
MRRDLFALNLGSAKSLFWASILAVSAGLVDPQMHRAAAAPMIERVEFPSADARTRLVGYLFKPANKGSQLSPAVVMMHGRAGPYSTRANGTYDASTLSQRHLFWGKLWAAQGYLAMLVDGFGPRGYPQGFARFSYETRPAELDEVSVRPLDAYGGLAYLRSRRDVSPERVGLQGWSNGASATLASMTPDAPGIAEHTPAAGFRGALAFYPACGLKQRFAGTVYQSYAPLRVFMGTADEEVSPRRCEALLRNALGDVEVRFYPDATHDFDDPGTRQRVQANAEAMRDAVERAREFFAAQLGGR